MKAVELFAGAGGLGLGLSMAGIKPVAVVEWDKWACDTIRENQERGFPLVSDWPLFEADVRKWIHEHKGDPELQGLDVVAGGPPCQPFSMGGKHRAHRDSRDMFPVTVEVIRHLKPKAFIIENVKGLTRPTFHNYYQYILLQLEFPELTKRADESWSEHYSRLQQRKTSKAQGVNGLTYNLVPKLLNAANHGVPQRRERVFMVGFRSDLGVRWGFPTETHSYHALLHDQWVSGEYWERHRIAKSKRPSVPTEMLPVVDRLRGLGLQPTTHAWRTTRDALFDLPAPGIAESALFHNHKLQPGARPYKGHTGSHIDLPAKTLKAGDHGVPGGENMLVDLDGSCRYFSVRESARLQTFPDGYVFHGAWSETMRQLGNAVPVRLARVVAGSVTSRLVQAAISNASGAKLAEQRSI